MNINHIHVLRYRIDAEDHPTVITAQKELTAHLTEFFGYDASLPASDSPYRILLGEVKGSSCVSDLSSLAYKDSFLIRTTDTTLEICGKTPVGTLYGVYHFLNLLGIDWLTPDVTTMETDPDMDFSESLTYDFPCEYRVVHSNTALSFPVYRTRQRLAYTVGPKTKHPSFGNVDGIEYAFSWGMFGHTFEWFIPYEEYFREHPEYFSFAPGDYGSVGRYQICLTNPDVFEIVKRKTLAYLAEHPQTRILSVSQNDSWGEFADNFCQCANCRRVYEEEGETHSGVILRFVNRIAEAVEAEYPDVLIHTFAYGETTKPPLHVTPRDNVMIQLCIGHEPHATLLDTEYPKCAEKKKEFDDWYPRAKHLQMWTYNVNYDFYLATRVNLRSIYADTTFLLKHRLYGIFQQECGDCFPFEFCEMRTYLFAKLFQHPQMSYEEYLGYVMRFLRGYYGENSAAPIFEYLMSLEALYATLPPNAELGSNTGYREFNHAAFIRHGKVLWAQALLSASDDTYKVRIENSKKSFDFAELVYLYATHRTEEDRRVYAEKKQALYSYIYHYNALNRVIFGEGPARRIYDISNIDWNNAPHILVNRMRCVNIADRIGSAEECHHANTNDAISDFGFTFCVEKECNDLLFDIRVTDPDPVHTTDNILSWEQDSVELLFSETLHRTGHILNGDFRIRVNADGLYGVFGADETRVSVTSERNEGGYFLRVRVSFSPSLMQSGQAIGFEMIAHNFGDGGYRNTVYWNSPQNADISQYPKICGKLNLE